MCHFSLPLGLKVLDCVISGGKCDDETFGNVLAQCLLLALSGQSDRTRVCPPLG
jgi:hypothetical protein